MCRKDKPLIDANEIVEWIDGGDNAQTIREKLFNKFLPKYEDSNREDS